MDIMRRYKAVIFDLDDTLYPEMDYVRSGFNVVAKYISSIIGVECTEIYKNLLTMFGENKVGVFDRILAFYGVDNNDFIKECVETYRNHFPNISLFIETEEILQWLKVTGIKIGIITDGRPEGQRNKIQALGLEKYCDSIVITDELGGPGYRKPSKVPYEKMLKNLAVGAKEAIFVGDNPEKDFVTANILGITTVMLIHVNGLYKQSGFPPTFIAQHSVKTLKEIKEWCRLLNH